MLCRNCKHIDFYEIIKFDKEYLYKKDTGLSLDFCELFLKKLMGSFGSIFITNDVRRMTPSLTSSISTMNMDSTKRRRNSSSPGCFHTSTLHDSPITVRPPPLPPRIQPMKQVTSPRKRMVLTDIHTPLEMAHSQRTILSILQSKQPIFEQPSNSA